MRQNLTKRLFCEALLDLCETEPLQAITATQLIQQANTARQTFYNHFRDINDLISYVPMNFLSESSRDLHDSQGVRAAYTYALEHPSFFKQLPYHEGQNNFRESFIMWLEESYYERYLADVQDADVRLERMLAIDLYVSGVTDLFLEWCRADLAWPMETMVRVQEEAAPQFVKDAATE